jgi:hypothetical protein
MVYVLKSKFIYLFRKIVDSLLVTDTNDFKKYYNNDNKESPSLIFNKTAQKSFLDEGKTIETYYNKRK